jgi:predicted PurR-regulated permease PerM
MDMFSSRQQKIISSAVTGLALLTLAALVLFLFRSVLRFLSDFSSVLLPLAAAGILSLLLRPFYQMLREKWKISSLLAVLLIFTLMLLPLVVVLGVFGGVLVSQINEVFQSLPELIAGFMSWLETHAPAVDAAMESMGGKDRLQAWMQGRSEALLSLAGGGARGILQVLGLVAGVFSWVVMPVYLFFLLIAPPFRYEKLEEFLPFLKERHRDDLIFLVQQFVDIVVVFFRGQLVIAFAQGMMMAIGFSLCGLSYGFLLGLLFGMLNLVPYLGNLVGLSITLPLAFFQPGGGLGLMIAVIVVLMVTQLVEGYVLTPKIMGESTGLHPMAVIFAMFFWGKAMGGILGLVLAIPLTAFLVVFWRLAKEKYLPPLEPHGASVPE